MRGKSGWLRSVLPVSYCAINIKHQYFKMFSDSTSKRKLLSGISWRCKFFKVYQHAKADCFSGKWKNPCKLWLLIQKQDNLPGKTLKNHYMKCFYVAWELSYMKKQTYKKNLRQDFWGCLLRLSGQKNAGMLDTHQLATIRLQTIPWGLGWLHMPFNNFLLALRVR